MIHFSYCLEETLGWQEGEGGKLLWFQQGSSDFLRCHKQGVTQNNSFHRKVQLREENKEQRIAKGFPKAVTIKLNFPRAKIMSEILPRILYSVLIP